MSDKNILCLLPSEWEMTPLLRFFRAKRSGYRAYAGSTNGKYVFLLTGIGFRHSLKNFRRYLASVREDNQEPVPDLVLVCGCAGSLKSYIKSGRICAADSIGREGQAQQEVYAELLHNQDPALRKRLLLGQGLSVKHPADNQEKVRLAAAHPDALFVDMESWWLVQEARAHGLPVLVLRATVDQLGEKVPSFKADAKYSLPEIWRRFVYKLRAQKGMRKIARLIMDLQYPTRFE